MSSEPRRKRAFRLALPQEIAWKGAFEATSHALLGGLRHIREEAVKKQTQVVEAIDNVRREAGHRLQNCLSHLERPVFSAPAFAAISGRFRPNPVGELALSDKDMQKKVGHILVYVVMQPKDGVLGLAADEDSKHGCFIFMDSLAAADYIRKVKKEWRIFEDLNLRILAMPLNEFHYYFMKKNYRGKLPTFFLVPEVEEVYYAAKLKEIDINDQRRREELIEKRDSIIKEEKEKDKAQKEANKRKKKGKEKKASPSEPPPAAETESPSEPPPAPPPPPEKNAKENDGKKEDSKEKVEAESAAELSEEEKLKAQKPQLKDIIIEGVPVFSCTGLTLSGHKVVPYFLSYRDLDCFMRATAKNTFKDSIRERDGAFQILERAEDECRKKLKRLKGADAEQMRQQLRVIEKNRTRMLYDHYYLPVRIAEASMNVEVTDLETLLAKWAKMKPKEAEKVMLYAQGTFYLNHNEEEDFYDAMAWHMDRTLRLPPRTSTVVPDHLLN